MGEAGVMVIRLKTLFAEPFGEVFAAAAALNEDQTLSARVTDAGHLGGEDNGFFIRLAIAHDLPFKWDLSPVTDKFDSFKPVSELPTVTESG